MRRPLTPSDRRRRRPQRRGPAVAAPRACASASACASSNPRQQRRCWLSRMPRWETPSRRRSSAQRGQPYSRRRYPRPAARVDERAMREAVRTSCGHGCAMDGLSVETSTAMFEEWLVDGSTVRRAVGVRLARLCPPDSAMRGAHRVVCRVRMRHAVHCSDPLSSFVLSPGQQRGPASYGSDAVVSARQTTIAAAHIVMFSLSGGAAHRKAESALTALSI